MKIRALLWGALIASASALSDTAPWFEDNTPLTQAHKHLLNNNLSGMFSSLVEVWQLESTSNLSSHLNSLLLQSLEVDCGKGLDTNPTPTWISSVVIRRTNIESPGRDAFRAIVEVDSEKAIRDIALTQWVSRNISTDNTLTKLPGNESGLSKYIKRYNLNSRLPMGLYRLDVTAADQSSWSAWVLLGEPNAAIDVRWKSKDEWSIDRTALLNPHCPLPKLETGIYDYVDGKYNQIWTEVHVSDFPTALKPNVVPAGRYVLAVSINQQRWQGPIIVEQSQIISKTYDVSVEE